jgi:DNA-directed RNA polymerase specialized sigma24 family protein
MRNDWVGRGDYTPPIGSRIKSPDPTVRQHGRLPTSVRFASAQQNLLTRMGLQVWKWRLPSRLARFHARKAKVVELRFFGGLSVEETAEVLKISPIPRRQYHPK